MRYFYSFVCFLFLNASVFAQRTTPASYPEQNTSKEPVPLSWHGWVSDSAKSYPLFVIDGKLSSFQEVKKLDVNTIEYLSLLKNEQSAALFCGGRAAEGLIIIATKSIKDHQFLVTDAEDNSGVSAATVTFFDNENDSLRIAADQSGRVETNMLKCGVEYKVRVTSVGYKDFITTYKFSREKMPGHYRLTRDIKVNQEVIVKGHGGYRRVICRGGCGGVLSCSHLLKKTQASAETPVLSKIYPNPVVKGNAFKVEFIAEVFQSLHVRVCSLRGAQLASLSYQSVEGLNRIEVPIARHWAAGMYVVQILTDSGEVFLQNKIVIQ